MRIFILLLLGACAIYGQDHFRRKPSFELDNSAKRKLVEKALALKSGDSFETITNALGTPSFDSMASPGPRKSGGFLRYDALIWRATALVSGIDEFIYFHLNDSNRLRKIEISITLQ
jgi:hypothetical protein